MASDRRLDRLRVLVGRLERLPESVRREWMLAEVRARMVDVETGSTPQAIRPLDPDSGGPPLAPQGSRVRNGGAVKRPSSKPGPATVPRRRAQPQTPISEGQHAVPAATPVAGPDPSASALGTNGLLWLEDPSFDAFSKPRPGS